MPMTRTPILITGCQRSGTTLMNLILDSHPDVRGIDEMVFFFPALQRYLNEPLPQAKSFVSFKLPMYAHMLAFIRMLPDCKVLWCIRDPMDVVASMEKLRSKTGNVIPWSAHANGGWGEIVNSYWALEDKQKQELREVMTTFSNVTGKLDQLTKAQGTELQIDSRDSVFLGALCWRIKNELLSLYEALDIDFYLVRYEQLVMDPQEGIASILDYLKLPWSDAVLSHHQHHSGMSIGDTSNSRAIDRASLGRGKKDLSPEEQIIVKAVCGKIAERLGYAFD